MGWSGMAGVQSIQRNGARRPAVGSAFAFRNTKRKRRFFGQKMLIIAVFHFQP
jgi:hypothetical protein